MIGDSESASPALWRLQLGAELRRLRIEAGLKSAQVVKRLLWSPSKLTRLEAGENYVVEPSDVMALCEIYGAAPETRALLDDYAAVTKTKRDWWQSQQYRPIIRPGLKAFLGLEATAASLHNYESEFVPGLLQTEAYVRAIHQISHAALPPDDVDRLVSIRMTRQEVLVRQQAPLKLVAIVNEAVLRRQVGSAALLRGQLDHIAEVSELPNVRVQVVPYRLGVHPGMAGPFVILKFAKGAALKPIVYLENLADAWVTRREADVEKYEEAFSDLQALAPGPQESLSLIHTALKEL
ncbi:helix-turn-helix transcriptional regulator [Embleya sp. NPDC005971]|uniref:helix-turn-helix domain-containing protein n=1 Tax=Embleya sp. NPDC005971 TaxID=3156724 RepID=UPI003410072A